MIRIHCPKCDAPLNADDSRAGTAVRCPKCGHGLRLPAGKGADTSDRPDAGGPRDEATEERPRRLRKKRKRQNLPGRTTLFTLVGIDVGASLLLGILILAGTFLGYALISPPLGVLLRMRIVILGAGVLGTLVLVRGAVGAALGLLAYLGHDIGRFLYALLLLSWAALAGVGFLLAVVDMIRFAPEFGISGKGILYLLLALLWQGGHVALGLQFLWNAEVQRYTAGRG